MILRHQEGQKIDENVVLTFLVILEFREQLDLFQLSSTDRGHLSLHLLNIG